jgi:hypothetical protein
MQHCPVYPPLRAGSGLQRQSRASGDFQIFHFLRTAWMISRVILLLAAPMPLRFRPNVLHRYSCA